MTSIANSTLCYSSDTTTTLCYLSDTTTCHWVQQFEKQNKWRVTLTVSYLYATSYDNFITSNVLVDNVNNLLMIIYVLHILHPYSDNYKWVAYSLPKFATAEELIRSFPRELSNDAARQKQKPSAPRFCIFLRCELDRI